MTEGESAEALRGRLNTVRWLGGIVVVFLLLGIVSSYSLGPISIGFLRIGPILIGRGGLALALAAIGIVTFLGFYYRDGDLRTAIAASSFLLYFALFALMLNESVKNALDNDVAKQMLSSLYAILVAVVGFYFGAKAAESIAKIREQAKERTQQKNSG